MAAPDLGPDLARRLPITPRNNGARSMRANAQEDDVPKPDPKPNTYGALLRNDDGDTYIGPISRAEVEDFRRVIDERDGLPVDPDLEEADDDA